MAVSNSRNEIQASIEDNASMLACIVQEINSFYGNIISDITNRIEEVRRENPTECPEMLSSMLSSDYKMMEWYEEVLRQTLQYFIPRVYSYAEKHIEGLLGRISYTTKKAREQYRTKNKDTRGVSDIEIGCYILCDHYNLPFNEVMLQWPGFQEFHDLRKDIEHRYNERYTCSDVDYIIANIENAKEFLSTLERLTRHTPSVGEIANDDISAYVSMRKEM